jgi:hypothetical protein
MKRKSSRGGSYNYAENSVTSDYRAYLVHLRNIAIHWQNEKIINALCNSDISSIRQLVA